MNCSQSGGGVIKCCLGPRVIGELRPMRADVLTHSFDTPCGTVIEWGAAYRARIERRLSLREQRLRHSPKPFEHSICGYAPRCDFRIYCLRFRVNSRPKLRNTSSQDNARAIGK